MSYETVQRSVITTDFDWISFRAQQSYPLADEATGLSVTGNILPPLFILDIQLLLPSKYNDNLAGQVYISAVQDMGTSYNIVFAYSGIDFAVCAGIRKDLVATDTIAARTYIIASTMKDPDTLENYPWMNAVTGNLCAGITSQYNGGSLAFDLSGTKLHSACIHFMSGQAVQAIKINNTTLTGVVTLEAGDGIKFSIQDGNVIKISVDEDYLNLVWSRNIAQYYTSVSGNPIRTINGISPDANGNITIRPQDCVQINSLPYGISISNPCAKPCCSTDAAAENLNTSIKILQEEHKTFRDYWISLSNVINYMQASLSTLMQQKTQE